MRTFIAIFFLIMFGIASNVKPSYFYYWKANQKTITTEFCENKDKPVLECNGKCYLKKKIEAPSDSKESNSRNLRVPTIEYIPYATDNFKFENIEHIESEKELISSKDNQIQSGYPNDCFKPPIFKV